MDEEKVTLVDDKCVQGCTHISVKQEDILRLDPLKRMVVCTIISTRIKGERPISLLITAKPESGKTSVMQLYKDNKGVLYLTDGTAFGIQQNYLRKIESGEIRTLMIPDLITPLAKQNRTRQSFIAFLNNLIEEGVAKIATGFMVRTEAIEVKANMVTAVTEGVLEDNRHNWNKMGFLSRFIVFSYSYSKPSVQRIMKRYSDHGFGRKGKVEKVRLKVPRGEVDVELPICIADKIDPIAARVGSLYGLYGFRAKINFRCLLKCLAYLNGRKVVTEFEFEEFLELAEFMNLGYKPI